MQLVSYSIINLKCYECQLKITKILCTIFTTTSVIILFYYIKSNYILNVSKINFKINNENEI